MKIYWKFLLTVVTGFVLPCALMAQKASSYEKEWTIIDSLISIANQPKTALAHVNKLYQDAHAKHVVDQSVKALAYKYVLDKKTTDQEQSENIKIIDQALLNPISPLERSLLWFMKAGTYINYYNRFQYKIQNRNDTLASKETDWSTWTDADFQWKIYRAYQNVWKDSSVLQQTKIAQYPTIVLFGNLNELRPTMYDLVVNSALDFYKENQWRDNSGGRNPFVLDNTCALKDWKTFLQYNPNSNDSISKRLNCIQLYQRLLRLHAKDEKPEALIDIDNQRIEWVYGNFYGRKIAQDDSLYLNSLRYLAESYPKNPVVLQSVFKVADYYNNLANRFNLKTPDSIYRYKSVTALSYIDQYLPKDSVASVGWCNLKNLKEQITKHAIGSITLESINVPDEPILALLRFYHLQKAFVKIVAISHKANPNMGESDSIMRSKKVVQQFVVDLPFSTDYQNYTTEIKIDPLPVGNYLMCVSADKDIQESRAYITFQVSSLAYLFSNGNYFVVNRKTGKPIEKVRLVLDRRADNVDVRKSQLISDANGHILIQSKKENVDNSYDNSYFHKDKDTLYLNGGFRMEPLVKSSNQKEEEEDLEESRKDNAKMLYFTDRNIYRPGQIIHFKAVVYTKDGDDASYHIYKVKDSLTFYLRDVNNKKVDSVVLSTNDFGAANGAFRIPQDVLTGSFTIDNNNNDDDITIQVEEYKRPTFFVEIDSLKGTYKLYDNITMSGTAKAYNGSKVSNAKVNMHIERSARFPYYWLHRGQYSAAMDILDTTFQTDAQGKFKLDFPAIPDANIDSGSLPVFQYRITTEVTDKNGETRSKGTSVSVGYNSVNLQWNVVDKAKLRSLDELKVSVKNTNDIAIQLPVRIKIAPVQEPKNLTRNKYWSQPDVQIMDSLTYKQFFPHDIYCNENETKNWKKEMPVLQKTVAADSLVRWDAKPHPGWYYLEATMTSPEGKEIKDFRYVQLLPKGEPMANGYLEGFGNNFQGSIGDTIHQYVSTANDEMFLTEMRAGKSEALVFPNMVLQKGTLPFVTVLKDSHPLNRTLAGYRDNRFYQASFNITVVPKEENLTVQIKTFRDKVEPGSKEKWSVLVLKDSIKVKNAELLSNMYDASLDQILKGDWNYSIDRYRYNGRSLYFSNPYERSTSRTSIENITFYHYNAFYPILIFENGDIVMNRNSASSPIGFFEQKGLPAPHPNLQRLSNAGNIEEVVVVGYGVMRKKEMTGSVVTVTNGLAGSAAGIQIRGAASNSPGNHPLYIIDGQIYTGDNLEISPDDILSMTVLKGTEATALYGAQATNGAIVITTKSQSYKKKITPPPLRSNFNETAFFYPAIVADKDGNYWLEFEMPDAVTQWRWRNLAMDKNLHFGYSEMMVTSQKTLMIQPNMPRFLRAGDQLVLTAKVSNTGTKELKGKAFIQLLDADSNVLHWQKIDQTDFSVAADQSATVAFNMAIPENYAGPLYVKVWAEGGKFSDGEMHEIPVLSRKTLVTEALPFELKGDTVAHLEFSKLLASGSSNTLQNKNLSIELATNPVWYAVQAIPYLQSFQYECSEQVFSRMYGGFLAEKITQQFPQIKSVLDKWVNDPDALKSNLQKNSELKQVVLEETPWLNNAESEAQQKRKLALYFNKDSIHHLLRKNFDLLSKRQLSDGSFSWYDGSWGDRYITQNIVAQYAHLQSLGAVGKDWQEKFKSLIQKARQYLSSQIEEDYNNMKKWKSDLTKNQISTAQLIYLYVLSLDSSKHKNSIAENYYLQQAKTYWNSFSNVQKAWIAEIFYRKGEKSFAINTVIRSLLENAVESPTAGTYWKSDFSWDFGYLSNIEKHSQIMTAINYIAEKDKNPVLKSKVEEMQHWLIRNKQTNYWSNTKATADACYALLSAQTKWISAAPKVTIKMGKTLLGLPQQEAATGYMKISVPQDSITPGLGKIQMDIASNPGYVYGSVYWQYLENLDKITKTASPLSLSKTFYKETIVNGERQLQEIKPGDAVKVGDKLIVRLIIKSDRDMQYVHLKDLRPSNTEPDDALSGYQYKDNLGYYLSVKDVSSNFFFNMISKGAHILEYSMHVTHAGTFASGMASAQCMYAPEMNSHSEGAVIDAE